MKHAVVAKAWVDLCYATNQQPVQKSHEFARLRTQVLQVQLVLHHLDSQDVMMKIHPPLELHFLLQSVNRNNVHKHHRTSQVASPAYPP